MSADKRTNRIQPQSSLRAWRKSKGFTQREAAAFLGISQPYYSKLEQHSQSPRPTIAKTIVELTGVPLDELQGIAL